MELPDYGFRHDPPAHVAAKSRRSAPQQVLQHGQDRGSRCQAGAPRPILRESPRETRTAGSELRRLPSAEEQGAFRPRWAGEIITDDVLALDCLDSVTGLRSAANVSLQRLLTPAKAKALTLSIIRCKHPTFSETAPGQTSSEANSSRSASEIASVPTPRQDLPGPARKSSCPPSDSKAISADPHTSRPQRIPRSRDQSTRSGAFTEAGADHRSDLAHV